MPSSNTRIFYVIQVLEVMLEAPALCPPVGVGGWVEWGPGQSVVHAGAPGLPRPPPKQSQPHLRHVQGRPLVLGLVAVVIDVLPLVVLVVLDLLGASSTRVRTGVLSICIYLLVPCGFGCIAPSYRITVTDTSDIRKCFNLRAA
eukprot:993948-Amorphochlora_amoeboformis.AAC.1